MVLTEEQQTDMYPAATLEPATIVNESIYYGNLTNTQLTKPSFFTDPLYPNSGNTKVARVKNTGTTQKVGPNMILKVMAGDSYNIRVASGWSSASAATNSNTSVVSSLLSLLSTSAAGASGGKATAAELQSAGSGLNTALTSFANSQTTTGTKPKAYLNWILLDEQFKVVTSSSGFEQVGASGATTIHVKTNIAVNKSGYLYVYTSNDATNIDVYFDNLQVTHVRGALLSEDHFYPFGGRLFGICSKSMGSLENRKKFNGVELSSKDFSDGSGLELYETTYRLYDPQIGRFHQIDALSELNFNWSTYAFAQNNPILFSDPYGLDTIRGKLPKGYDPQPGDVWINKKGKEAVYDAEDGWVQSQTMQNVTVGNSANKNGSNGVNSANFYTGLYGIGWDAWYNTQYKGDWMYRNSKGQVGSIFDTKYGSGQNPNNIGNANRYSKHAQSGIRGTRVVKIIKTASGVIVVLSLASEFGQAFYAYANNDPNADAYLAKAGVSTGVTLISASLPGVGWVIGAIYFGIDATIGWPAAIGSYIEIEKNKTEMRKLGIMTYSDFKYEP
jgi:RHS repeat-associated protein